MIQEFLRVGRIVNAHGIHGEVRVQPRRITAADLSACRRVYIAGKVYEGVACRVHKHLVLMRLPGVADMDAALSLQNEPVFLRRADAQLPPGTYFDDELLGLAVYNGDSGGQIGVLTAVEDYPAGKLYTVEGKERRYLVPAVPEVFIRRIDMASNRMDIVLWEGL